LASGKKETSAAFLLFTDETVQTDWQWPLSTPDPPFILSTIMSKVVVYALAERADKLLLFLLYPFLHCNPIIPLSKQGFFHRFKGENIISNEDVWMEKMEIYGPMPRTFNSWNQIETTT
jgi:hypothetical protein